MALKTEKYLSGEVTILRCLGRLVVGEETAFRQGVENLLSGKHRVVINLTEVDHIDSTGLSVLVHLLTQKREPGSDVKLVSSTKYLPELLRSTWLDTVITVYASEEEAVASFPKRPH